jgi:hypothetical protein
MSDTGSGALGKAQEKMLEYIANQARKGDHGDVQDIITLINALGAYNDKQPKNGDRAQKIMNIVVYPLLVAAIIGGIAMYGEVQALKVEIGRCLKVSP